VVRVEIKFCGLTRPADAALGAALGARYLGVIFAPSPRRLDASAAKRLFQEVPAGPKRVGVFGDATPDEVARTAQEVRLDVIQLHADPKAAYVEAVRQRVGGEVWAACRIEGDTVPNDLASLAAAADAILLDARPANGSTLGGTGKSFDWEAVVEQISSAVGRTPIVLAGGLSPANVARAIAIMAPGTVDVSSGVESAPGIKDENLMRAFARAVGAANK
jgi:phosphoribosylanthranilate isomerase